MRWSIFLMALLLSFCARERSAEDRHREDANRTFERLNFASGSYSGYLLNSDSEITPVSMVIQVVKNPTSEGEAPTLSVGLRMGLFGGITIASTSATFDWGANEFVATFGPSKPGNDKSDSKKGDKDKSGQGLELRGIIHPDSIENAVLIGSHLGERKIVMNRGGESLFDSETKRSYDVLWNAGKNSEDLKGQLEIKIKSTNQEAPASSDMPYLMGLDASLKFDSFAAASQNVVAALYDPTKATLDLQFTDFSWLRTSGVSLSLKSHELSVPHGNLNLGGTVLKDVVLKPLAVNFKALAQLPPSTYLGIYQGSPDSIAYKAIGYLNFSGGIGANKLDLPFLNFPMIRMELDICNGDVVMTPFELKLDVLDFLKRSAVFHHLNTDQDPLVMNFDAQWSTFAGAFLQTDPHSGGNNPKVTFRPNAEVAKKGCAAK